MEKKLNSFILSTFTIIILSVMLLPLFLLLGRIDSTQSLNETASIDDKTVSRMPFQDDRETVILSETPDMGQEYIDRLVFLGESTTYGLWRYGILSDGLSTTQVWTGASCSNGKISCAGTLALSPSIASTKIYDPETGNAVTIAEAISAKNPEYLIITLGLNNGASYYSEDQFKQCYRILLNSVFEASSETVVILQSLFPVAEACKISVYTPERLSLCNSWICDLATEYGIKYLDTFSILSNEQGYLKPEYDNGGDGIHLNAEGLQAVVQYIRTHGYSEEGGSLS